MLRVGFFTSENYASRRSYSGVLHGMHSALRRRMHGLVDLGNPSAAGLLGRVQARLGCVRAPLDAHVADFDRIARGFCADVERQLERRKCDVLFAPVASLELFHWNQSIPIVYCSDATFRLYQQHYRPELTHEQAAFLERVEARAIAGARRLLYPSRWAADSAVEDYHAAPSHIDVAAFGANIDQPPRMDDVVRRCHAREECRLVFVGADFRRKGGDIAVETVQRLNALGVKATLTMVGAELPATCRDPHVQCFPFLSREKPRQRELLHRIYVEGHFFLFPTRADCSPIVLSEAAAYGLPVLSTSVGGIPDIVHDSENGRLLPTGTSALTYAQEIAQIWESTLAYRRFVERSRHAYDTRLNWDAWAARADANLRSAVATR